MDIFINTTKSPASLQSKPTSSPISLLKLKRGAVVPLNVTILGASNASNLKLGVKARDCYEGELLLWGNAIEAMLTEEGMLFSLNFHVASDSLNEAFELGEQGSGKALIDAMLEFVWEEDGVQRTSETLLTYLLNDIIRDSTEAPTYDGGTYPAPDTVATKSWVRSVLPESGEGGSCLTEEEHTGLTELLSTDFLTNAAIDAALEDERLVESGTLEGADNANLAWAQFDERLVTAGKLLEVSIPCRSSSSSSVTSDQLYLHLWQANEAGVYEYLATSSSTAAQALGQLATWQFENGELSGRSIRLFASTTDGGEWESWKAIGAKTSPRPAGDSVSAAVGTNGTSYNLVLDVRFKLQVTEPRFALSSALKAHESAPHLSEEEHAGLSALLANTTGNGAARVIPYTVVIENDTSLTEFEIPLPSGYEQADGLYTVYVFNDFMNFVGFAESGESVDYLNPKQIIIYDSLDANRSCAMRARLGSDLKVYISGTNGAAPMVPITVSMFIKPIS